MEDVTARNKEIALKVWGHHLEAHNMEADDPGFRDEFEKYYHEDYWNHASPPGKDRGFENVYNQRKIFHKLFADYDFDIDMVGADGDLVFMHGMFRAKHVGAALFEIPATGVNVSQPQVHILRLRDFKITDHWVVRDDYVMYRQMVPVDQEGGIMRFVDTDPYEEKRQATHGSSE